MNPRIGRDPYLRLVAQRWGEAAVVEAGWFDDGDPTDAPLDDVDWLCTPTDVVRRGGDRLTLRDRIHARWGDPSRPRTGPATPTPVVLLSTGGFFPVHRGHLAMMEAARRHVDGDERRVVGGYLSPAHDDYIRLKCGAVDVPVSERLARAEAVVAPSGWLSIDPWEALARRVAVNFTDVTARLEAYLRHHVHPGIDVVYVCGGDNARFSLAFSERGGCIVVGRPGSETIVDRWRTDPRLADNPRIAWIDGDDPTSSASLRTGARPGPPPTRADRRRPDDDVVTTPGHARVTLRLEDERAVTTLGLPADAWRRFQAALEAELASRVALRTVSLEDQDARAPVSGTLSLDPMLPAEIDIGVSRLFELGGYRPLHHTTRPGSSSIEDQLAAIPPGTWALRDDDRSTGATVRFVTAHLPAGVTLAATTFALDPDHDGEIADSRDFLLGTDHGGLVVALPDGSIGRAPYVLPYVDPSVRSGLPGTDAVAFSLAVWELNAAVFVETELTADHLPPATARTLAIAGHLPATPLIDVCRWHAEALRSFLP